MSGTSLVILAMYSTVNVVGPAGTTLPPSGVPYIVALLMTAAALTAGGLVAVNSAPRRVVPKGPTLPRAKRRLAGPRERRV